MTRLAVLLLAVLTTGVAADWPEWRGEGRRGEWTESGILEKFPADGLKVTWRRPLGPGFSGPSVAAGRIYVADYKSLTRNQGLERVLCLDEQTGEIIWTQEWEADYTGLATTYAIGPRATPTIDGERLYMLGASGILVCLRTEDGSQVWHRNFQKEFDAGVPVWGFAASPIVDGGRLICMVGGEKALLVGFDKTTGEEVWRAGSGDTEPGYSQPILIEAGGARQLIMWHSAALTSVNPQTGKVFWEQPFRVHLSLPVATPIRDGAKLLVSSFFNGSLMMDLAGDRPQAKMVWKGKSESEIRSDGLHALITTPVFEGGYIYGIGSYGQFRCLRADTGERVWETLDVTGEKARWAAGFIVRNSDRYFINTDAGDLVIAQVSPEGYQEIDRTLLIKPTSNSGNRRKAGAVNWSHPAYANRHIVARNDEEIIRASLANETK
jgi:outer membrane protein assembly factor BamB